MNQSTSKSQILLNQSLRNGLTLTIVRRIQALWSQNFIVQNADHERYRPAIWFPLSTQKTCNHHCTHRLAYCKLCMARTHMSWLAIRESSKSHQTHVPPWMLSAGYHAPRRYRVSRVLLGRVPGIHVIGFCGGKKKSVICGCRLCDNFVNEA